MGREFRVQLTERETWIRRPRPDDQWDAGVKEIHVDFLRATICDENSESGSSFDMIFDEDSSHTGAYRFAIPWNFSGSQVYLVVARYDTGSTFGQQKNDWEIHGVFNTCQKAIDWSNRREKSIERCHQDYFGGFQEAEVIQVDFHPQLTETDLEMQREDINEPTADALSERWDRLAAKSIKKPKKRKKYKKRAKKKKVVISRFQRLEF
jgi:hypothetical protein